MGSERDMMISVCPNYLHKESLQQLLSLSTRSQHIFLVSPTASNLKPERERPPLKSLGVPNAKRRDRFMERDLRNTFHLGIERLSINSSRRIARMDGGLFGLYARDLQGLT